MTMSTLIGNSKIRIISSTVKLLFLRKMPNICIDFSFLCSMTFTNKVVGLFVEHLFSAARNYLVCFDEKLILGKAILSRVLQAKMTETVS